MLQQFAMHVTDWLIRNECIAPEEAELYQYAATNLIMTISPLGIVLIIGGAIDAIPEGIVLILPFILLRSFSGGYHFSSKLVCFLCSTGLLLGLLLLTQYLQTSPLHIFVALWAGISIVAISPLETPQHPISPKERSFYKAAATVVVALCLITYTILYLLHSQYAICIMLGLALTACLQYPCILQASIRQVSERTTADSGNKRV